MNIHLITFANTQSGFSLDRIRYQAENFNLFNSITTYTEHDFDDDFLKKTQERFSLKRGYGYWCWKPYFILKKIKEIQDGDFLLYIDCGCSLNHNNKQMLLDWIKMTSDSKSGILSPCHGPYLEREWTKMDLHNYINDTYNHNKIDLFSFEQTVAGVVLFQKRESTVEFASKWNDIMQNHFSLCTDEPSVAPNDPGFRENRHDQSVFSMLCHIEDIVLVRTENGIYNWANSPVTATRIKNDKYTFRRPS